MLRHVIAAIAMVAPLGATATPFAEVFPDVYNSVPADLQAVLAPLDLKSGAITLSDSNVQLQVPEDYYFLNGADAQIVLEQIWENPAGAQPLGMLFPRGYSPIHSNAWGIEITYEAMGYVSDEDAATYDYDDLLKTMQSDIVSENTWRTENGFPTLELIGWAATPHYDQAERKLHWAKELHFEGADANTLNYNIRALGRHGVLVMNFIADMDSLPEITQEIPDVMGMVSFAEGSRYTDFQPGVDKVAAVGIGGLIAGKVLAKTGLLAVALVFLKKAWFLLLLPLLWLKNRVFGPRD